MIERQTAKKVRVWDIMNGSFVKKEGFEPSFVQTKSGEEISRARILGTVVSKFVAEDGNFASITIDDGSDTIRLKVFKTTKPLDKNEIGDVVDVIGKVREYEGEIYIIAEVSRKIKDPNFEMLRRAELVLKEKEPKSTAAKTSKTASAEKPETPEKPKLSDKASLKMEILKVIEESKEGIVYSELMEKVKAKEADLESAIDELLNDGICYEPSPGKIRKI